MEETDVVAVLGCRSSEESVMKTISMKRATLLVAIVKGRSAYTKRMYGEVVKSGPYSKARLPGFDEFNEDDFNEDDRNVARDRDTRHRVQDEGILRSLGVRAIKES
jgi:hypothetical protein